VPGRATTEALAELVPRRLDLRELRERARPLRRAFGEHRLGTHAAAIAFRVLVGLVPLVLLSVALLGTLGLESTWTKTLAPELEQRLTEPVFGAIDFSVQQIFESTRGGLIAFASLLLVWQLFRGVRAATVALNEIHDVHESRGGLRLVLTALGLAVVTGVCLVSATLVMIVAPRVTEGQLDLLLSILRWPVAFALLGLCVGLLVRYAPAERPEVRWASMGSAVIVAGWMLLSLVFGFWVTSIASYKGAVGNLAVFLVLTAYVLAASAVFLAGVELNEAGRARDGSSRSGARNGRGRSSRARRRRRR
jgi:membrane protein